MKIFISFLVRALVAAIVGGLIIQYREVSLKGQTKSLSFP